MQYVSQATPGVAADFFGPGKGGFQNGDPTTGVRGTLEDAAMFNEFVGNLCHAVERAGIALTPGRYDDLADAIVALSGGRTLEAVNVDGRALEAADGGKLLFYNTTASAFTTTLDDVADLPATFAVELRCEGPYPLTIEPAAGNTVEGQASVTLPAGWAGYLVAVGTAWKLFRRRSGLYAPGVRIFGAAGSFDFTVPDAVALLDVEVRGAGGGGAGAASASQPPGSGSGGGYSRKLCTVKPGDVIAVVVGAGGTAGGGGGGDGGTGGTSSFGAFCSATGGGGGNHNPGNTGTGPGTGIGGDLNLTGIGSGVGRAFSGGGVSMPPGDSPAGGARGGDAGGGTSGGTPGSPGSVWVRW